MKIERANQGGRTGVTVPTPAEFALAKSRGRDSITGDELRQMRAEARATRKASVIPFVSKLTQVSQAPSDTLVVTKLKRQIERLKNEIVMMKVREMTK